jgi:hypothetical protein
MTPTPTRDLRDLAEHFHYIYTTSKECEMAEKPNPHPFKVVLSEPLLKEWAGVIKNPNLTRLLKPNTVYSDTNPKQAEQWNVLLFNSGYLLSTFIQNGEQIDPIQHEYLQDLPKTSVEARKKKSIPIDMF